jgi:murein tripeptide amidase MpaA
MNVNNGKSPGEFWMRFGMLIFAGLVLLSYASNSGAQLPERYTRYSDALQTLADLQADYPEICKLDTMGYSMRDSVPMLRVKISDNVDIDEDEAAIFYCGGVHADEVLGIEVVMWFIQDILNRYGRGDLDVIRYINDLEIFCIPFMRGI